MRIGIDCRLFSPKFTGIGRYTHELVEHFIQLNAAQKYPHQLVLFFNQPEYKEFKTSQNVEKVLVNAKHYSFKEQTTFAKKLYQAKLDIAFFPHFNIPILYRKKYIVTIHDLTLSFFPGEKMTKWYHRLAYNLTIKNATRKAKKVIAVSKNTKQDLINHLKVPEEKITVIYNGVSPEFTLLKSATTTKSTLKKYKITKDFLLYTGVWRSHKNLPKLLEAFNKLVNEHSLDLQLVITGKEDPHYPEVKDTVKKYALQDHVVFPGLVSDKELIHLYNAALFYVFPSLYEGFGIPPLESMACGSPVVASDASCIPEICGPDNAVYFNPHSPEEIANAVHSLYQDVDLQAQLVESGLRHSKSFTWDKSAKKTYQLLTSKK